MCFQRKQRSFLPNKTHFLIAYCFFEISPYLEVREGLDGRMQSTEERNERMNLVECAYKKGNKDVRYLRLSHGEADSPCTAASWHLELSSFWASCLSSLDDRKWGQGLNFLIHILSTQHSAFEDNHPYSIKSRKMKFFLLSCFSVLTNENHTF